FLLNHPQPTEPHTLSLHDALPISTVEEIAEGMDISEEEVAKTLSISQAHLSLDAPLTPGEDNKLLDYLPDTQNPGPDDEIFEHADRKSTRLNSSHGSISYAVFCLK